MEDAVGKVERLEESIEQGKSKLDILKEKEEGAYEREDESDKKSSFLAQEVHEMVSTAEEKEREVANLERYKDEINAEINDVKHNIKEVFSEMEKLNAYVYDF